MKKLVKVDEVKIESLIKKNFSEEFMRKIYDVYSDDYMSIVEKTKAFDKMFTEEFGNRKDYRRIGEGTNRFVCLLDNHIIKVAYNYLAYIDNMNELAQAKDKPKYLAHAYETNGIILVSEYVTVMDKMDFLDEQRNIKDILHVLKENKVPFSKEKTLNYILGDMGTSEKNYGNWGKRMNGDIVVLDYGYLYEMNGVDWQEISKCPSCGSSLTYEDDFSELRCDQCRVRVKYTTLRSNFGYEKIIENINKNLNKNKIVKFDENGVVVADVMETQEVIEEVKEEFKLPEDIMNKLNTTSDKFLQIYDLISRYGELNINVKYNMKEKMFEERELYDEFLFPFIVGVLDVSQNNIERYSKDFDKIYEERYNELYINLKKESESEEPVFNEEVENFIDTINEEEEERHRKNLDRIDSYSDNSVNKADNLEDLLGSFVDTCFNNLIFADESKELNKMEDSYELDYIMDVLNKEKTMADMKREEKELSLDERMKIAFEKLEKELRNVIANHYTLIGLSTDEEDYSVGDVYRTYINGDIMDYDYSPSVNARNILGGYKADEFAYPLYRHLLVRYDYDLDVVQEEYEAIYRKEDEELAPPKDMYSKLENRSMVIEQIMKKFNGAIPAKNIFINQIGSELNDYFELLDEYYEEVKDDKVSLGYNDPEYYLMSVSKSINSEIQEARRELKDDLSDQGYRLEGLLDDYRIVYDYDIEGIMNDKELEILDMIKNMKFNINDDIKNEILNKYYEEYGKLINDESFEVFKYNGSTIKDRGCLKSPRPIRSGIKARLVKKESNEDSYKPEMFERRKITTVNIEQRYEVRFNLKNPDEVGKFNDLRVEINRRNLRYTILEHYEYTFKNSMDNIRYLLTEREKDLLNKFNDMLGLSGLIDKEKAFAQGIVEVLERDNQMHKETKELFRNIAKTNLSEALSNRAFKINILQLSGSMTRIDYLNHIEG